MSSNERNREGQTWSFEEYQLVVISEHATYERTADPHGWISEQR